MVSPENSSNWMADFGMLDDIPLPGGHLPVLDTRFHWPSTALPDSTALSSEYVDSFESSDGIKEFGSRKRVKPGSCKASNSKACREKMRRDRLNDRFQELSSVLEPGRPPKMDKAILLSDTVRMVTQLRDEARKLKESHEHLQAKVNELKAEKNELRDEKQKLKAAKEKLEQKLKALDTRPGFFPPAQFPAPGHVLGGKMVPFMGYPGVPMWQFTHPAAVDTSQDHAFHSPVA